MKKNRDLLKCFAILTFLTLFALTGLTPSVHAATSKATATVDYGTKDLALGSQGSAVTQLQKDLAGLGFYSNSIDGSFGAKTKNAVVSFQKSQGLKTDGVVGPITKAALNKGLTAPAKTKRTTVTIAAGTTYATPMYIIDSGVSGPVVMIVGGVHGNEPAGYTAAGKVKDWDIKKGKLIVLPQANKKAVENKTRTYNGDLNRDFPQSSKESCDNTLSKSIYAAVKSYDVDWLMDMHEGYNYTKISDSVGQSLIYYPTTTTKTMASAIVSKLNSGISTSYKKFSLFRYPVEGSLARASGQYLGVHAFIFETSDNPSLSVRVNYHLKAADTLLSRLGVI